MPFIGINKSLEAKNKLQMTGPVSFVDVFAVFFLAAFIC